MPDREEIDELAALMGRSLSVAMLRGAEHWARLEVTMPQLKVLMLLGCHGSSTVTHLAAQMKVSPPNVTGILDRLAQHGWIRREPDIHDRRVVRVFLTPEGISLLDGLQGASAARTRAQLAEMAPADQAALGQGLRALLDAMPPLPEQEPALVGARSRA
jgi:DNA-binding MarR family transcriptional regulator